MLINQLKWIPKLSHLLNLQSPKPKRSLILILGLNLIPRKKKAVYIDFTSPNRMSKEELNTYFTTSTKARTTLTKAALSKMESQVINSFLHL